MEHAAAKRPQIGGNSARSLLHEIPANQVSQDKMGFHGKEGVDGSSPSEGSRMACIFGISARSPA